MAQRKSAFLCPLGTSQAQTQMTGDAAGGGHGEGLVLKLYSKPKGSERDGT